MAQYTCGSSSYALRNETLNASTVADIASTGGADAYTRVLYVSNGGVANNLTVTQKGSAVVYNNGLIDGLILSNGGAIPRLQVSKGGTVRNATISGTVECWAYNGGKIDGATVAGGAYVILYSGAAMSNTTFNNATLFFICSGAVASNITIKYNATQARNCLSGGVLSNCNIYTNGIYYMRGGTANEVYVSGGAFHISGGAADNILVSSGGKLYVSNGTLGEVTQRGAGSATTVIQATGGTIDTLRVSGGGVQIASDAVVNNLIITASESLKVWISSGGTVNGGETTNSYEFRMEADGGTIKDFTVGEGTYVYWSAGHASNVTFASNAGKLRFLGSNTAALTIESSLIYRKKDGSDNRGLIEGTMIDCTIMDGGYLAQSGGLNNGMTVAGTLDVSAGTAQNTTVAQGGVLNVSAGTVAGVVVQNGGKAVFSAAATGVVESGGFVSVENGAEVAFVETALENFVFTGSATLHEATTADHATVATGGNLHVLGGKADNATVNGSMTVSTGSVEKITVNDGGTLIVYTNSATHGEAIDITLKSGANLGFVEGAWAWGTENWALASNVVVEAGASVTMANFTRLVDVQAGEGAVLVHKSNRTGLGGANTNIAKGVINDGSFGDDFEVVNGVATGLYLTGDGTKIRSCGDFQSGLTIKDASVVSGGSAYFYTGVTIDGLEVYGTGGTGGTVLGSTWLGGVTGSGIRVGSGGSVYASNADLAVSGVVISGGTMDLAKGNVDDALVSGGTLTMNGADAVIDKLTVVSGAEVGIGYLYASNGTINSLTHAAKGSAYLRGVTVNEYHAIGTNGIPRLYFSGGVIKGGDTTGTAEFWMYNGAVASDMTFNTGAYVHVNTGATVTGGSFNGTRLSVKGTVNALTIYKSDGGEATSNGLFAGGVMSDCTVANGAIYQQKGGSNIGMTVSGTMNVVGGTMDDAEVVAGGFVSASGGTIRNLHMSGLNASGTIMEGTVVSGATIEDYAIIQINSGAVLYDPILRMNTPTTISGKYARINIGNNGVSGGVVSGGLIAGNGNTIEFYMYSGGVASDVLFENGAYVAVNKGAIVSGGTMTGGTINMRSGEVSGVILAGGVLNFHDNASLSGLASGITVTDTGRIDAAYKGEIRGAVLVSGGSMRAYATANEVDGTVVSNGGEFRVYTGATVTNTTVSSGGKMFVSSTARVGGITAEAGCEMFIFGAALVEGITAEAGALVSLDFSGAGTGATFDTLADCNTTIDLYNVGTATKTFNIATTGNTNQQFAMLGSGIFEGTFKAGDTYVDPFTCQQLVVAADATTIDVTSYTRTSTTQAVGFASSGTFINNGKDKELMWNGATVSGAVKLIDADAAAAITGDAWMDICACSVDTAGAAIYGTDVNIDFNGKVRYQLHGGGDTVGNLAAGANYGGSVKGVEILTYNTTYTGVGYAGGFGDVDGEIDVIFAGGNTINKDFYGGALYNASKVAANTTTSVGDIKMTFGEKATNSISVKGNVYGASAVKAGTVTTAATLHTVGDVELTLKAGTLTDGKCVFAGGYATGHDTAKTAPVYTVESVTVSVTGGSWGLTHGGRGIFGGAMASDNLVDGAEASGVYAQVGNVNMTITGGTMGNVYGGGWAQKGAKSEVGNVNMTITGGTMGNIFGGGSTSTSGGSTVAGDVTITVSGGTISNAIYARGQFATDATGTASVIFTGSKSFTFADGVYGYSNVSGIEADGATLSFTGYTGTFTGKVGGFDSITLDGATAMTLGTAYEDVKNTAWTFDAVERDAALAGTAFLSWSDADFTGGTITLNQADGDAVAWDLVSAGTGTVYNKFDVRIDGQSILSETIDIDDVIAGTGTVYDGWGFTDENGTLKFKQLA